MVNYFSMIHYGALITKGLRKLGKNFDVDIVKSYYPYSFPSKDCAD